MSVPHVDKDDDEESSLRMGKRGDEMSVPHVPHVDKDGDEAQLWAMRCLYHMFHM